MTVSNKRSAILRGISLSVAVMFTVTSISMSPSGALAYSGGIDLASQVRARAELNKDLYAMPAELGSLVSLWEPPAGNSSPAFVVHIQDAHANPEAQRNIAAMLNY